MFLNIRIFTCLGTPFYIPIKFDNIPLKNTSLHPLTHTERNPGSEEDVFKAFAADDLDRALAATVLVQVENLQQKHKRSQQHLQINVQFKKLEARRSMAKPSGYKRRGNSQEEGSTKFQPVSCLIWTRAAPTLIGGYHVSGIRY